MGQIKFILIFLMLFIIPVASGLTEYQVLGGNDTDYLQGVGIFDDDNELLDVTTSSFALTGNARGVPLVADLDNDGVNEIVIHDRPRIRIFDTASATTNLNPVATLSNLGTGEVSNTILFDIDGDNVTEIIFHDADLNKIRIIEWNGSVLVEQTNFTIFQGQTANKLAMIRCRDVNECLVVASRATDADAGTDQVHTQIFNSTNQTREPLTIYTDPNPQTVNDNICFPKIRHIALADYDGDGTDEFIFSFMKFEKSADEELHIAYMDINSSNQPELETQSVVDDTFDLLRDINPFTLGDADCDSLDLERFFTSPLVADLDIEAGLETVVGVAIDDDQYGMLMYGASGCSDDDSCNIDDFPEVTSANGEILSNPFLMNAFDETGLEDFCVLGYAFNQDEINLVCGTTSSEVTISTREYEAPIPQNITRLFRNLDILTHAVEMKSQADDTLEILTTYGVYEVDNSGTNSMERIWSMPQEDGVAVPVDVQRINVEGGSEDIIYFTESNLYYNDDGRSNSPAVIIERTTNPCVDAGSIKINSTFVTTMTVRDVDGDKVAGRVTLYEGSSNEQITNGGNFSDNATTSGTPPSVLLSFTELLLNQTISGGTILYEARDTENPTIIDEQTFTFSVGITGVEFGDCTTTSITIPEEEEEEVEAGLTEDADDNAITNSVLAIVGLTGLGGTTLWLLFMMVVTVFIWFEMAQASMSGSSALGTIAIFNVLAIILGSRLGMISTGLVVILVVMGVVIIGVFLGKFLTGLSSGQGE